MSKSVPHEFKYDVFLSHSSRDKPVVRELAERLRADGLRVWLDDWEILPGNMILHKIENALQESRIMVLAMSENFFKSDWAELESGAIRFQDPTNKEGRCIPLRLNDADIPITLKQFAYIDWRQRTDEDYRTLLNCCAPPRVELHELRQYGFVKAFRIPVMNYQRNMEVEHLIQEELRREKPEFRLVASSGECYLPSNCDRQRVWNGEFREAVLSGKARYDVVLQSPDSDFAVARALANEVDGHHWGDWICGKHMKDLAKRHNVNIRVTDLPVNCSMFFTSTAVLLDPYFWAKIETATENHFWVFEFTSSEGGEPSGDCYAYLEKHFAMLFEHGVPLNKVFSKYKNYSLRFKRRLDKRMTMPVPTRFQSVSYHNTWISLDPIRGCPFNCVYCVLRHSGTTGTRPQQLLSPKQCVTDLLEHRFFIPGKTPLAIGTETDMFYPKNVKCLIDILAQLKAKGVNSPVILPTKAPLSKETLERIRDINLPWVFFFLSYSGLGIHYEPGFTSSKLEKNFDLVRSCGFRLVHYWRPLLPQNTNEHAIRKMIAFSSANADATVFTGMKMHPELTRIITKDGAMHVPPELRDKKGEWLDAETVGKIYSAAAEICPKHPLYRHASCALACLLMQANHTGTVFRDDICRPSQCPEGQRAICRAARQIPEEMEISRVLSALGRKVPFQRFSDRVRLTGEVSQEEFAFLLHNLNCPLEVPSVKMQRLYHGDIFRGQLLE